MDILLRIKKEQPQTFFISECLRLILFVVILTLTIISSYSLSFSKYIFEDLMNNWQKYPIEDISLSVNGTCDYGYSPLINNEYWPGTTNGCKCPFTLTTSSCDSKDYLCYTVWSRNPRPLKYWRRSLLCAKPFHLNYLNFSLNIPKRKGECAFGYKNCGEVDTLGNDLCIEEKFKCPITNIKIVDAVNVNQTPSLRKYKALKLNDGTYLLFGNGLNETYKRNLENKRELADFITVNNKVVVDLKFSEGQVCVNPYQKNTRFKQYKLMKNLDAYTCRAEVDNLIYDDRFDRIDTYSLANIYQENNVIQVINELPSYPRENLNANIDLYTRDYIGIKYNCLNDEYFSPYMMNQNSILISKIFTTNNIMLVLSIIIMIFFIISKCFDFKVHQNNSDSSLFSCLFFTDLILIFLILAFFISLISCYFAINRTNDIFINFKSMNCGDQMTNKIFINFGERIFSAKSMTIVMIIITFLSIITQPITYLIVYSKCYRSIRNEELVKMNANSMEMAPAAVSNA